MDFSQIPRDIVQILLGIVIGLVIGYLSARMTTWRMIQEERKMATKQSRNVILGEVNEKIAPILPGFPYDFKDLIFIGKGIDYLVFDGLSAGQLEKIVLLELKTGGSQLNRNEKMIKECLRKNKIQYEVLKVHL